MSDAPKVSLDELKQLVLEKKNTIVYGIAGSGKTACKDDVASNLQGIANTLLLDVTVTAEMPSLAHALWHAIGTRIIEALRANPYLIENWVDNTTLSRIAYMALYARFDKSLDVLTLELNNVSGLPETTAIFLEQHKPPDDIHNVGLLFVTLSRLQGLLNSHSGLSTFIFIDFEHDCDWSDIVTSLSRLLGDQRLSSLGNVHIKLFSDTVLSQDSRFQTRLMAFDHLSLDTAWDRVNLDQILQTHYRQLFTELQADGFFMRLYGNTFGQPDEVVIPPVPGAWLRFLSVVRNSRGSNVAHMTPKDWCYVLREYKSKERYAQLTADFRGGDNHPPQIWDGPTQVDMSSLTRKPFDTLITLLRASDKDAGGIIPYKALHPSSSGASTQFVIKQTVNGIQKDISKARLHLERWVPKLGFSRLSEPWAHVLNISSKGYQVLNVRHVKNRSIQPGRIT
jgi:hypothetical protein